VAEAGEYREQYRREHVPAAYSGWLHLCFTFGVGLAILAFCLLRLQAVQPLQWLTIPVTFLYANLAEYLGHRGPMHHRVRGLGLVFERHTRQHHRFFTHQAMQIDRVADLKAVLFPPVLITFFVGVFAVPVGLLLAWLFGDNVGYLFVATAVGYFLNYEVLHLAYHLPAASPIGRLPLVRRLGALHRRHHDPRLMSHWNFNISYPFSDLLFGTLYRGAGPR